MYKRQLFANPRNAAAGSLRQLDPKVAARRRLDILVFNVQWVEGETFSTHLETLEYLKTHSFKVIPHYSCDQVEEAVARIARIGEERDSFPFDIDGAVSYTHLSRGRRPGRRRSCSALWRTR